MPKPVGGNRTRHSAPGRDRLVAAAAALVLIVGLVAGATPSTAQTAPVTTPATAPATTPATAPVIPATTSAPTTAAPPASAPTTPATTAPAPTSRDLSDAITSIATPAQKSAGTPKVACPWPSIDAANYAMTDHWSLATPMGTDGGGVNIGQKSAWIKHSAPTVAELDGNGTKSVIVGALDGKIYIFDHNGCRRPGWPVTTGAYSTLPDMVNSTPAVGDIDGDGQPEIVAGSENGWVFAWHTNGQIAAGWPQFTGVNGDYPNNCARLVCWGVFASPTLADINGDGLPEVIVGAFSHKMWVWNGWGQVQPGWPRDVYDGIASSAAVGDINGDGRPEIVFGSDVANDCSDCPPYGHLALGGLVHAMSTTGDEAPGWPQHTTAFTWSSPVLYDVTGDGIPEVAIGVGLWPGDFSPGPPGNEVTMFRGDGSILWRFFADNNVEGSPAIADMDGNGTPEMAIADISGFVYLFDARNGALIWKVKGSPSDSHVNTPAFGDVDGDGIDEVVVAGSNDWRVRAWNTRGQEVWEANTNFGIFSSPVLADLDNSGSTWIVAGTGKGDGPSNATAELLAGTGILFAWKTSGRSSSIRSAGFHQGRPQLQERPPQARSTVPTMYGITNAVFRIYWDGSQVATDPDGDPLAFDPVTGENSLGAYSCGTAWAGRYRCYFAPWAYATGSTSIQASVTDLRGGHASMTIPITILPNSCVQFQEACPIQWASPGDIPAPGDYNDDGRTDLGVFRPDTGTWYARGIFDGGIRFGVPGDTPRPGDYNGDGRTDLAVFRSSTGFWYIDTNRDGVADIVAQFGGPGDLPCTAKFTQTAHLELCVFRPSNGTWYIDTNLDGTADLVVPYASPGDIPAAGDYDGDGRTDLAVFRPSTGRWFVRGLWDSGRGYASPGDVPGPADYTGDGVMDVTVFRPSTGTWWVRNRTWPWP